MTEKEAGELLSLCRDFSALDRDHRQFALDISKGLLSIQIPQAAVQAAPLPGEPLINMEDKL